MHEPARKFLAEGCPPGTHPVDRTRVPPASVSAATVRVFSALSTGFGRKLRILGKAALFVRNVFAALVTRLRGRLRIFGEAALFGSLSDR